MISYFTKTANMFMLLFFSFVLFLAGPAAAEDNEVEAGCKYKKATEIFCDLKLRKPEAIKSVKATANGKTVDDAHFKPFDSLNRRVAWLFMIDVSNPRRRNTVKANVEVIQKILQKAKTLNGDPKFGVATIAGDIDFVIPLGTPVDDAIKALSKIKAEGLTTELYRTSLEAIKKLDAFDADRKALVVFSDGNAEDAAYGREEVVQAANDADINIFGLGYAEPWQKDVDKAKRQNLRRMAEKTDGYYAEANVKTKELPAKFTDRFLYYLVNGGTLEIDAEGLSGSQDLQLEIKLSSGQTLQHKQTVVYSETVAADKNEKAAEVADTPLEKLVKWAEANKALAVAIITGLTLLLLLLIWGLIRALSGTKDAPELVAAAAPPLVSEEPIVGWFEMLDANMERHPIRGRSMRIGRGDENELRFDNDTVSSRHAHFYITRDGAFMIDDLGSANKTLVNDEEVTKHALSDNDVIELGEVRFRFIINQGR